MIETAVRIYLLQDSDLADAVGTRIMPQVRPQTGPLAVLPSITYQRISTVRYHAMQADADLVSARVQYDVWADSFNTARRVASLLIRRLQNASGTLGSAGTTAHKVAVLTRDEADGYEDDTGLFHVRVDFTITHAADFDTEVLAMTKTGTVDDEDDENG